MTNNKPTTIEIFSVCSTGKSTGHDDASPMAEHNSSSPQPCHGSGNSCQCKSLCIKISDSHGHLTNFIPLSPNGAFQKKLLEQRVSIVSQTSPLESVKPKKKSYMNLLVDHIPAFGIMCALISVLCFSFNSVIVKLLKFNYGLPGIQVLVTR